MLDARLPVSRQLVWRAMELRDFAERVLFATTLDEKLQSPAAVTDERPGSPLLTTTKLSAARELNRWIIRATTSFPVPVYAVAVGGHAHAGHPFTVAFQDMQAGSTRQVPDPQGVVPTGRDHQSAIGSHGQAIRFRLGDSRRELSALLLARLFTHRAPLPSSDADARLRDTHSSSGRCGPHAPLPRSPSAPANPPGVACLSRDCLRTSV